MRLMTVHKILIVAAIALGAYFGFWSLARWRENGASAHLVIAIVSWIAAGLAGGYLGSLRGA